MIDILATNIIPVTTAILTAASVAIVHYCLPTRSEKLSKKRSAALISTHLERFAIDCADLLQRYENYVLSNGCNGDAPTTIAKLEDFPADVDLTSISPEHVSEALAIQNLVVLARKSTSSYIDIVSNDDEVIEIVIKYTALLGSRSMKLGAKIREYYRLPKPDYLKVVWDIEQYLSEAEHKYYLNEIK
jgi:hypothetical protein